MSYGGSSRTDAGSCSRGSRALPEYEALLRCAAGRFELALRARGEQIVTHNLVAFVGAPGATVPVHFDRNHHLLMQIRGTKTVGTGTFTDPVERQRQLERGLQEHRLNADIDPDTSEERCQRGSGDGDPRVPFHWVHGADDLSIACHVHLVPPRRRVYCRAPVQCARPGVRAASRATGKHPRVDRVKQRAVNLRCIVARSAAPREDRCRGGCSARRPSRWWIARVAELPAG